MLRGNREFGALAGSIFLPPTMAADSPIQGSFEPRGMSSDEEKPCTSAWQKGGATGT